MLAHVFWKHLSSFVLVAGIASAIVTPADSQTESVDPKHTAVLPDALRSSHIFEDSEIKLEIPAGWTVSNPQDRPPKGMLLLEKSGYRLSLGYHLGHASGIVGGRFIEAFAMNWPGLDDAWNCSLYLKEYAQPASRNLVFVNLIIDSGNDKVRENCGIQKNLGYWTAIDGAKQYQGELRWFGGYFREAYGGYFFGPEGDGCAEKAYTLTSLAGSPEHLPTAEDPLPESNPALEKVINEVIDIINSIHYKQCAPF